MKLPGRGRRGGLQRRFVDVVKEDMQAGGVTVQDVRDRLRWRKIKGEAERRRMRRRRRRRRTHNACDVMMFWKERIMSQRRTEIYHQPISQTFMAEGFGPFAV